MRDKEKNGGLAQIIPSTEIQINFQDKISQLVNKGRFMVFIRGTPEKPACAATRKILALVKGLNLPEKLEYFNLD